MSTLSVLISLPPPDRWLLCPGEVGDHVAAGPPAVLHRAQLCSATLAPLVHGHLFGLHPVDRCLLLPHGVDGKRKENVSPQRPLQDTQFDKRVKDVYHTCSCTAEKMTLMSPPVSGHHYQPHTRHPRLHHGDYLPGSRDQRSGLHGKSDCGSAR